MLKHKQSTGNQARLLALVLASGIFAFSSVWAAAQTATSSPAETNKTNAAPVRFVPSPPRRAQMYYGGVWGIDDMRVKQAESGELIKFTWRVLDPTKAKPLNDKKIQPTLIDPQAGVQLVVPVMEKVGQLRQTATPEAGKSYWMAFSNRGRPVKRGDRVTIVIGQFKIAGLMVE